MEEKNNSGIKDKVSSFLCKKDLGTAIGIAGMGLVLSCTITPFYNSLKEPYKNKLEVKQYKEMRISKNQLEMFDNIPLIKPVKNIEEKVKNVEMGMEKMRDGNQKVSDYHDWRESHRLISDKETIYTSWGIVIGTSATMALYGIYYNKTKEKRNKNNGQKDD